jgi:hypothetical protein
MTISQAPSQTFFAALVDAIHQASAYNRNDLEPPAAVLWTDRERQWEPLLPRLREALPLLTLGQYDAGTRTGPSYWLRCAIARALPEDVLPSDVVPILYLPGVSRQDMRAVEEAPKGLQPLAELQYRGVLWNHRNGRDWTPSAFLQSEEGGLGIEVGTDLSTREAIGRTLLKLADEPVDRLRREAPLRTAFFDTLLHPDEVRNLLQWLNAPDAYRQASDGNAWAAFRALCRSKYGFGPNTDGEITAARLLGERDGAWEVVWRRFREAPTSYGRIPDLLRAARPTQVTLPLWHRSDSWPQENEERESDLRAALLELANCTAGEARKAIAALEIEHGARREWVWAELGHSPLATALRPLSALAAESERSVVGSSIREIAERYASGGWRADLALLDTLASVDLPVDVSAVKAASSALYRPWLEVGAKALQDAVRTSTDASVVPQPFKSVNPGVCVLFCDGLRYDVACRLEELLRATGYEGSICWRMAALPAVTPTAKPAVTPVAGELGPGTGFDTIVKSKGTKVTAEVLRKLLSQAGYEILKGDDLGDPSGRGWTEMGTIDSYGHEYGWKVAAHIVSEVRALRDRIAALLDHGWKQVVVVTDHGWLLLPGALPKVSLPEQLTEIRKGRCARLKPLASTDQQSIPWFWDPDVQIAVAPGISCYEAGKEYEHGGISPQECVVPVLTVSRKDTTVQSVRIAGIAWKGLRCVVTLEGGSAGIQVDLRTKPRDPASSLVTSPKSPSFDGAVSLLVPEDSREGEAAMAVVLSADGAVLAQETTVVGG